MVTLTPQQIAGVAQGAGFTGSGLQWAVAVALAESGGRTDATNINNDSRRTIDRGVWQINSFWHKEVTAAAAFDPNQAAAAAFRISKRGTDWSEWSSAKNGAALAQLGRASLAAASPTGAQNAIGLTPIPILPLGGAAGDALGDTELGQLATGGGVADSLSAIGKSASVLASGYLAYLEWITDSHNIVRLVYVGLGAAGALAGLIMLSQSGVEGPLGSAGAAAANATGKATKATKAAAGVALTAGAAAATGGTSAVAAGTAKVGAGAVKAAKVAKAAA